jgi:hypothetical protein
MRWAPFVLRSRHVVGKTAGSGLHCHRWTADASLPYLYTRQYRLDGIALDLKAEVSAW